MYAPSDKAYIHLLQHLTSRSAVMCALLPTTSQVHVLIEVDSAALAAALLGAEWQCGMQALAQGAGIRLLVHVSRSNLQTQVGRQTFTQVGTGR